MILGIETSCDETAAAVVRDGRVILSNVIYSQSDIHCSYGGVVPELASRKHLDAIIPVVTEALNQAGVGLDSIAAVGVTSRPGLVGSLLIGLSFAKALAFAIGKPLVGVNHIEGHIAAIFLDEIQPLFPFLALVVSGGHTNICLVDEKMKIRLIGQTRDDAAGEAFDKGAKLLNIGYPGGIVIDALAQKGNPAAVTFPRPLPEGSDFSFSGLKTALLNYLKKNGVPDNPDSLANLAASYQEAIVDVLVAKTLRAAELIDLKDIVVCGGVAANSRLRFRMAEEARKNGYRLFIPPLILCTDNAAMIAAAAYRLLAAGHSDGLDLNAVSCFCWDADGLSV